LVSHFSNLFCFFVLFLDLINFYSNIAPRSGARRFFKEYVLVELAKMGTGRTHWTQATVGNWFRNNRLRLNLKAHEPALAGELTARAIRESESNRQVFDSVLEVGDLSDDELEARRQEASALKRRPRRPAKQAAAIVDAAAQSDAMFDDVPQRRSRRRRRPPKRTLDGDQVFAYDSTFDDCFRAVLGEDESSVQQQGQEQYHQLREQQRRHELVASIDDALAPGPLPVASSTSAAAAAPRHVAASAPQQQVAKRQRVASATDRDADLLAAVRAADSQATPTVGSAKDAIHALCSASASAQRSLERHALPSDNESAALLDAARSVGALLSRRAEPIMAPCDGSKFVSGELSSAPSGMSRVLTFVAGQLDAAMGTSTLPSLEAAFATRIETPPLGGALVKRVERVPLLDERAVPQLCAVGGHHSGRIVVACAGELVYVGDASYGGDVERRLPCVQAWLRGNDDDGNDDDDDNAPRRACSVRRTGFYGGVSGLAVDGGGLVWQAGDVRIKAFDMSDVDASARERCAYTLASGANAAPYFPAASANLVMSSNGTESVRYWRRSLLKLRRGDIGNAQLQWLREQGLESAGLVDERAAHGWADVSLAAMPAVDGTPGDAPIGSIELGVRVGALSQLYDRRSQAAAVSGSHARAALIVDLEAQRLARVLLGHLDALTGVSTSANLPESLATSSRDGTAKLWDTRFERTTLTLDHGGAPVNCALIDSTPGANVPFCATAAADDEHSVRLWDLRRSDRALTSVDTDAHWIVSMAYDNLTGTLHAVGAPNLFSYDAANLLVGHHQQQQKEAPTLRGSRFEIKI
jgi:hypothetical protein